MTQAERQVLVVEAEALQSESDMVDRRLHEVLAVLARSNKVNADLAPEAPPGTFLWFEC